MFAEFSFVGMLLTCLASIQNTKMLHVLSFKKVLVSEDYAVN